MEKSFEKCYISSLWGRMRIIFSFKLMLFLFYLKVRDLRTDFLSTCRRWCQQCSYYLYLISLGALALVGRQSRGLISYSEPHSLFRVQLDIMGNKLKKRKFVLPYFSGWLFSMDWGSCLWLEGLICGGTRRQTTFDHLAQSSTLDSILEHKSNFRKFAFNSQQR